MSHQWSAIIEPLLRLCNARDCLRIGGSGGALGAKLHEFSADRGGTCLDAPAQGELLGSDAPRARSAESSVGRIDAVLMSLSAAGDQLSCCFDIFEQCVRAGRSFPLVVVAADLSAFRADSEEDLQKTIVDRLSSAAASVVIAGARGEGGLFFFYPRAVEDYPGYEEWLASSGVLRCTVPGGASLASLRRELELAHERERQLCIEVEKLNGQKNVLERSRAVRAARWLRHLPRSTRERLQRGGLLVSKVGAAARAGQLPTIVRARLRRFAAPRLALLRKRDSVEGSLAPRARTASAGFAQVSAAEIQAQITQYKAACRSRRASVVVYTAIAQNSDVLKIPESLCGDWDYVCFSDRFSYEGEHPWQIRSLDYFDADPQRTALYYQCLPHRSLGEYAVSIWVAPSLLLKPGMLENVVAEFLRTNQKIAGGILEGPDAAVLAACRAQGLPGDVRVFDDAIVVRRHNDPDVQSFNRRWWREVYAADSVLGSAFSVAAWREKAAVASLACPASAVVRLDPVPTDSGCVSPYRLPTCLPARYASDTTPAWHVPRRVDRTGEFESLLDAPIDIVVCCHNSPDDVAACLRSVAPTLERNHRLIVIDDNSAAPTRAILDEFVRDNPKTILIRHSEAHGYTRSANEGLHRSTADFVILLNSDTIVAPRWSLKMLRAARSAPDIGIVGPLSNAASWQSIPRVIAPQTGGFVVNAIPDGYDVAAFDRLVEEVGALERLPKAALVNGFCFGIRRAVLDSVGYLDEAAFPLGYGEEDDLAQRAVDAGFIHVIAADTFVFHAKSKSFGADRRARLAAEGFAVLKRRHGAARLGRAISALRDNPLLQQVRCEICERTGVPFEEARAAALPTVAAVRESASPSASPAHPVSTDAASLARRFPDVFPAELRLARVSLDDMHANEQLVARMRQQVFAPPRRAVWIVPSFKNLLAGGIRTIVMAAEDFSRRWGTENHFVFYQTLGTPIRPDIAAFKELFPALRFTYSSLSPDDSLESIPDADFAFCTSWPTAYVLLRFQRCAAKFYFMQDYESLFYPAGSVQGMIDMTYRLGFFCIANSPGIAERYPQADCGAAAFIPGVDTEMFFPAVEKDRSAPLQVVFYGRPKNSRNAFALGIAALRRVKERLGDRVRIVSVGAEWHPRDFGLEGIVENLGVLKRLEDVAELYRRSDAGLVLMLTPHPSYQPLEFMASGCATVTNVNSGTRWLLEHERNAVVTEICPESIAAGILRLLEDRELRTRVVAGGLETARSLRWERAFDQISRFVLNPDRVNLGAGDQASLMAVNGAPE